MKTFLQLIAEKTLPLSENELLGLDGLVAAAEGLGDELNVALCPDGYRCIYVMEYDVDDSYWYSPTRDFAQGGKILAREKIKSKSIIDGLIFYLNNPLEDIAVSLTIHP